MKFTYRVNSFFNFKNLLIYPFLTHKKAYLVQLKPLTTNSKQMEFKILIKKTFLSKVGKVLNNYK